MNKKQFHFELQTKLLLNSQYLFTFSSSAVCDFETQFLIGSNLQSQIERNENEMGKQQSRYLG